jgi:uncharacterized repeat protein (TIGR01451 family)
MKTKLFKLFSILYILLSLTINVKAQYVEVQDPNFRSWLQEKYPSCFNGDMLDTTCYEVVNERSLYLPTAEILPIQGIKEIMYFDSLKRVETLYDGGVEGNIIIYVERFPSTMKSIKFIGSDFSILPAMPLTLDSLVLNYCYNLSFQSFSFPSSLTYLDINSNNLNPVPPVPAGIKTLNLSVNNVPNNYVYPPAIEELGLSNCNLSLVPTLPNTIALLNIEYNPFLNINGYDFTYLLNMQWFSANSCGISQMPILSNNLNFIQLGNNQLTHIDSFPTNCSYIVVSDNQLTSLPALADTLIFPWSRTLICSNNFLTELPLNIENSHFIDCHNNFISALPQFTNFLSYLNFENNQVSCLPILPSSLYESNSLYYANNPFECVPNYVPAMTQDFMQQHPLCVLGDTAINPFNCSSARGVIGKTFKDENNNCISDSVDVKLQNIKVNLYNPISDDFISTYSFNGIYNESLFSGMYIATIDTLSSVYEVDCEFPGIDTMFSLTPSNPLAEDVNFSLKCKNGKDVGIHSVVNFEGIPFPGQLFTLKVNAGDISQWYGLNCAANTSGTFSISYNGNVSLTNVESEINEVISGNTITFNIADFSSTSSDYFLTFLVDTFATVGDQLCLNMQIQSDTIETNYVNNNLNYCVNIVNSYDPNMKVVYPKDVEPGFEDWFTYTIYFQNLGNAPAFNIRILDSLDNNLRHETFQLTAYSHFNTVTMNNGILTFRFPNIMLPDSASNPEGSIGFIQYRIKPLPNLPVGTQIENTAHIYFDFNPAIVTNTTVNEYFTTVTTSKKNIENEPIIFPNPSNGVFYFGSNTKVKSLEVFDFVGNIIMQKSNANNFDLSDFSNGIYFVRVNGNQYSKVIKN